MSLYGSSSWVASMAGAIILGIRLGMVLLKHFKILSEESGIPCLTLINLSLGDCAAALRKLSLSWKSIA